jgi:predicted nucleic acid-binding protein
LLADFLPYAEVVVIKNIPDDLPLIRYRHDQKFLILAVTGKAEVLVSGDADILEIKSSFHSPPIMSIGEFKNWLELGATSPSSATTPP